MKNTLRLIGIIALAVIIGFSMTACDPNNGDQNCATCGKFPCECPPPCTHTPGAAATCTTAQICTTCEIVIQAALNHTAGICTRCGVLRLSGLDVIDDDDSGMTEFTEVYNFITGTPKIQIIEGKLTIELDQPKSEHMSLAEAIFWAVTADPNDALIFIIHRFLDLDNSNYELVITTPDWMQTANLIYSDKDVVLNGGLNSFSNLTLKRGWNYLIRDWNDDSYSSSQTHPEGFVWTIFEATY